MESSTSRRVSRQLLAALLTLGGLALAATAQANGALPATIRVLLPPAPSQAIVLGTTFGLTSSLDGGRRWEWICEHDDGAQGSAYQIGAPGKLLRLYSLATAGIVVSDDLACGWWVVMDREIAIPLDYFPHPVDPNRLLALGILRSGARTFALLELTVGARGDRATQRILYTAPAGYELSTVEIARSDPRIIYATVRFPGAAKPAQIARSDDGGAHFTTFLPSSETSDLGIAAIDPVDPERLYFRVMGDEGDKLIVSGDGGKTLRTVLAPPGRFMSALVALPNGHVLVGWLDIQGGYIDRSLDRGDTFAPVATTLHLRAFAERAGRIYAAADLTSDHFALALSDDEGTTWRAALALEDVTATACAAAPAACTSTCNDLVSQAVLPAAACPTAPPPDAAPPDSPAEVDSADVPAGAAAPDAPASPDAAPSEVDAGEGCGCSAGARPRHQPWWALTAATLLVGGWGGGRKRMRLGRLPPRAWALTAPESNLGAEESESWGRSAPRRGRVKGWKP